jgi:hypothetical protein
MGECRKSHLKESPVVTDILVADLKVTVDQVLNGADRPGWLGKQGRHDTSTIVVVE